MRTFLAEGDFVAGFMPDMWSAVPESVREEFARNAGGEEKAKRILQSMVAHWLVLHEISHVYENRGLPLWFAEAGAYHYSRQSMKEHKWGGIRSQHEAAADFYQELLAKYGDDVHKIFFGQIEDKLVKQKVFSEFTEEKKNALFPDYRGSDE